MTERLERIEAALALTQQIADSNARSIAANSAEIAASFKLSQQRLDNLANVLEESILSIQKEVQETTQQVQSLIDSQQATNRELTANAREHSAFREAIQTLLSEIARLWQRLAS